MITLTHFLRGPMDVVPVMKDGTREWFCPNRPMLRPMDDCEFTETRAQIEDQLRTLTKEGARTVRPFLPHREV